MKKLNSISNVIKIIAIIIDIATILFALTVWIRLPNEVPLHFSSFQHPDRYGSKIELLITVLFPVLGMIPWKTSEKEYHSTDEETLQLAAEEHKQAIAKRNITQIAISLISCALVFVVLFFVTSAL